MKTETKDAIKKLAKKGGDAKDGGEAMKLTQAALNLAHVLATLDGLDKKDSNA